MGISPNLFAVILAALIQFGARYYWYSDKAFGKVWLFMIGKKRSDMINDNRFLRGVYSFLSSFVMAYVLGFFLYGAFSIIEGVIVTFWIWLGFVATTTLGDFFHEKRPPGLYLLNNAFYLITMMIMGIILTLWR